MLSWWSSLPEMLMMGQGIKSVLGCSVFFHLYLCFFGKYIHEHTSTHSPPSADTQKSEQGKEGKKQAKTIAKQTTTTRKCIIKCVGGSDASQ